MKTILERLRDLTKTPGKWGNEKQQRRAEVLHASLLLMFVAGLLYLIAPSSIIAGQDVYVAAAVLCSIIGSLLLRFGYLKLSSVLTVSVFWLVFTAGSFTEGGITSGSFAGNVAIVILAGLVLGLWGSITVAVGSILAGGIFVYLSFNNLLPEPLITYSQLNIFADFSIYLAFTALFTGIAVNRIEHSSARSERELEELKNAEDALRESENKYRELFDSSHDALFVQDMITGSILDVNKTMLAMFGYADKEEVLQCTIEQLSALEEGFDEERIRRMNQAAIDSNSHSFEWRAKKKDGETFWAQVSLQKARIGGIERIMTSVRDITGQRHNEEELQKLASVVRYSSEVVNLATLDGKMIFLNEAGSRMLGISPAEVEQCNIIQVIPAHLKQKVETELLPALMGVGTWAGDLQYLNLRTGRLFDVHAMAFVVKDLTTGVPLYLANVSRDITERKHAEDSLRESEERWRSIIKTSPDGIAIASIDGVVQEASNVVLLMLGYTQPEEVVGMNMFSFLDEGHHEKAKTLIRKMLDGIYTGASEYLMIKKDGSRVIAEINSEVLRDKDGLPTHIFFILRDITERKREALERQAMHEITQGVTTTANLDELFKLMHRSIQEVLYAENCFVALHDQNTGLFSFPYFVDQFDSIPLPMAMLKSCTAYVFRSGKPMLITPGVFKQLQEQNEVELVGSPSPSWIGVPLRTPSRTIGVLVLQHYGKENIYSERDLSFLCSIGSQVAIMVERKQADAALRESETKLNVILESTADGILAVDGKGKVIRTNRRFAELWRIPQPLIDSKEDESLLHYVVSQLVDPEEFLAKVRLLYSSADDDRDTLRFKDGRVFERYSTPITMGGTTVGRVWSFRDITERKQAEETLRESEERYHRLTGALTDYIFTVVVANGRVVSTHHGEGCSAVTGYTSEELAADPYLWYRMIVPGDRSLVEGLSEKLLANQDVPAIEHRIVRKDGMERWVRNTSVLHHSETGQLSSYDGMIQDITERKQAEKELLEASDRLSLAARAGGVGIWDYDVVNNVLLWDDQMFPLYGITREQFGGAYEAWRSGLYPDDIERGDKEIQMALRGEKEFDTEFRVVWRDGTIHNIRALALVHRDASGKPLHMVGTNWDITESKRAEDLLKQTRDNYESFFNTINEFLFVLDEQGNIIHTNSTVHERLGYAREELYGKSVLLVHPPEHRDEAGRIVREMLEGTAELCPVPIATRSGVRIPVETRVKRGIWNGKPVVFGVTNDISRLTISEEKFSKVFFMNPSACGLSNLDDHKYVEVNDAFYTLFGFDKDEVIGRSASELGIMSAETINAILQHADENGKLTNAETDLRSKQGEMKHVLLSAENISIQDKHYRFTMVHDITEHKRAEEARRQAEDALRYSEIRFRTVWNNSLDAMRLTDADGTIVMVNSAYCQLFKKEREESVGYSLADAYLPQPNENIAGDYCDRFRNRTIAPSLEIEATLWNGEGLYLEVSNSFLSVPGQPELLLSVFRDVTDRKHAEEALRHAQKLESIGTLAGGIAHDFNNLLNAMLGQSTLAIGKLPKESPAKSHIDKSIKAAERAADLTRQLLAYSGGGKFVTQDIDLNRLVKENTQMLETSVPKTAEFQFELDPSSPHIQGDVSQIQQVIMNLIINAGEAIGLNAGSIKVRTSIIDLTRDDDEYWKYTTTPLPQGRYALLKVTDSGRGMKPEVLSRIFDPFFTTKFTGRGLGLAAVLGIIRSHHGGVRIASDVGKGTQFEVVFPIVATPPTGNTKTAPTALTVDGKGRTVLVIDDEPSVLELLTDIFTEANFTVMGALNPMEGIELYRRHQANVAMVVLDYSMPGMNGNAAFKELVKINKEVRVLLCSGYTEEETASVFGEIRPAGFLEKPYQPAVMLERIARVLED
jgi:PAS domain S-box-containing protein